MHKPDRFAAIRTPRSCWLAALEALRAAGREDHEVMVYFAGTFDSVIGTVARVVVPAQRQSAVGCEPGLAEIVRVSRELANRSEVLLWQLHSHPGGAFLSETDRTYPASLRIGWFSAVAADFGRFTTEVGDLRMFERRGVHEWHELDAQEIAERFEIVDG